MSLHVERIYHTWDRWECYPAGFYENKAPDGASTAEAIRRYADFLRDEKAFGAALGRVITEWPNSCEHYLSNENMNRIAWLGQASACIALGLPSCFRGGFNLLSKPEQEKANAQALAALNRWMTKMNEPELTEETVKCKTQVELY